MSLFHVVLIMYVGNVIAFSPTEKEKKAMTLKTLRSVENMRRLFKLPKGTPVIETLQYYNTYNDIARIPQNSYQAIDVIPFWKRSSLESIGQNTALTDNLSMERRKKATNKGYSKQTLNSVEKRRLFKLPKERLIQEIFQHYIAQKQEKVDKSFDVIPYWKRSSLESIGKNRALTENSPMDRKKRAMSNGYSKQTMRFVERMRRLFNLPKITSDEKILQYLKNYHRIARRQENVAFPTDYHSDAIPYFKGIY